VVSEYRERETERLANERVQHERRVRLITALAFVTVGGALIMLAVQLGIAVIAFVGIVVLIVGALALADETT
jgi:uncharacterized membrane protein HdeD (DUF308 family)